MSLIIFLFIGSNCAIRLTLPTSSSGIPAFFKKLPSIVGYCTSSTSTTSSWALLAVNPIFVLWYPSSLFLFANLAKEPVEIIVIFLVSNSIGFTARSFLNSVYFLPCKNPSNVLYTFSPIPAPSLVACLSISSNNTIAFSAALISKFNDLTKASNLDSIDVPTKPGNDNSVVSIFKNGFLVTSANFSAINVLPHPVGPTSNVLIFIVSFCRLSFIFNEFITACFASSWPTMYLSNTSLIFLYLIGSSKSIRFSNCKNSNCLSKKW